MAFSPESGAPYGVYHSTFDSFEWMDSEGDPGFVRHVAMARLWGLVALRLAGDADADAPLPLNLTLQAEAIGGYISAAQAHARNVSSSNASRVDFGPLEEAHARFAAAAGKVGDEQRRVAKGAAPPGAAAALNEKLAYAERRFLSASGLPTRKYFRHVLQAPGLYTGYAPKTLPGVYDAVSAGDWATADAQARVAAERIDAAASFLLVE